MQQLKPVLFIFLGVVFLTLMAQLKLEVADIPITGQSLAVLIVGALLGPRDGSAVVLLYLLAGALGAPVFAGGASGTEVITGGSGGYLIGFIPAAYLMGIFKTLGWNANLGKCFLAMILGTLLILIFGVGRLTMLKDFSYALDQGFYPVLPGAAVKIMIGALFVFGITKWKF